MGDLLSGLRTAATIAGPNARELYLQAAEEIERCHKRLEIDHHFVMSGGGGELVRRETPYEIRHQFPDAVECRDATIVKLERDEKGPS